MKKQSVSIYQLRNRRALVAGVVLSVAILISILFAPQFLSIQNLSNVVEQLLPTLLASLGQMFVVLIGGLDLTVGAIIGLTSSILAQDLPLIIKLLTVLFAVIATGTINGLGVAKFQIHPIIMTLGTMVIINGIALMLLPTPGGTADPILTQFATGKFLGIHASIYWSGLAVVTAYYLIHKTWLGLHLFAVGGNSFYAKLNGVRTTQTTIKAYILSSGFAALAAIYLTGRLASGDPNLGADLSLDSIVAVALGGTSLSGGIGTVFGTLAGVMILGITSNALNLMNINPFYQFLVKGLLLVIAVSFFRRKERGL